MNYFIGRCNESKTLLKWAEDRQHNPILEMDVEALRGSTLLPNREVDPAFISRAIWSYLNLAVKHDVGSSLIFNNVEQLNGLEAWRKLIVSLKSRTPAKRHELYGPIHAPKKSKKMTDMIMTMESWEKDLKTYYEAGGATVSEDDKVIIAIKMLPMNIERSSLAALRACRTYEFVKQEVMEINT